MLSCSSTVIISSSPITKVSVVFTLTIAEIHGTWPLFWGSPVPVAWPPNFIHPHWALAPKCGSQGGRSWLPFSISKTCAAGLLQKVSKQARSSKRVLIMQSDGTKSSWSCFQNMLLRVGGYSTSLKSPYRKSITASPLLYTHSVSMELLQTLKQAGSAYSKQPEYQEFWELATKCCLPQGF